MNGEPLGPDHGFPARLIVPPIYGMKNVKWLKQIEAVDEDYQGYWQARGWIPPAIRSGVGSTPRPRADRSPRVRRSRPGSLPLEIAASYGSRSVSTKV